MPKYFYVGLLKVIIIAIILLQPNFYGILFFIESYLTVKNI